MASEFEKVVGQAHAFDVQHGLPDRRDLLFQRAARRYVVTLRQARIGRGQGFAVELAVGGQWQVVEQQHVRRNHVVGQRRFESGLELGDVRTHTFGYYIGHQVWAGGTVWRQDHGIADAFKGLQAGLDLTQFDTEAADLYLVVDAADVLDHAIGAEACEVARAIETAAIVVERVGNEAGGAEAGTLEVTVGQTRTTNVQLADAIVRDRVELGVEQVPGQVRDRLADGADVGLF
ncbi:hypothetical protein D3C80_220870 [compost metagenome]